MKPRERLDGDSTFLEMEQLRPEADLHCHLLPDWDDGPRTFEDSLELARAARESGIKQILVTPHVGRRLHGIEEKPSKTIVAAVAELEAKLHAEGVDISLLVGAELTMDSASLPNRLQKEPSLTVAGLGRYALIESTRNIWPAYSARFLQSVFFAGVTPIIAHPERYLEVQKDITVLRGVFDSGALLQITARSLLGNDDRRTKRCALELLRSGMVAIVASDAHNARAVWPADTVSVIVETVGESEARRILLENPRKILAGEPVYNTEFRPLRRVPLIKRLIQR